MRRRVGLAGWKSPSSRAPRGRSGAVRLVKGLHAAAFDAVHFLEKCAMPRPRYSLQRLLYLPQMVSCRQPLRRRDNIPSVEDGQHPLRRYLSIAMGGFDILRRDLLQFGEGSQNDLLVGHPCTS